MIKKIMLNGIPVYKEIIGDETWFYLFENNKEGNVVVINNNVGIGRQLDIAYLAIQEKTKRPLQEINTFIYLKSNE
jgi:outer membrane protein assembly factor BamE (lipoprotein component of BamABCDE complex)